jgi:hypothetical protein
LFETIFFFLQMRPDRQTGRNLILFFRQLRRIETLLELQQNWQHAGETPPAFQ